MRSFGLGYPQALSTLRAPGAAASGRQLLVRQYRCGLAVAGQFGAEDQVIPARPEAIAFEVIPEPAPTASSEDLTSAWGWGAGVELSAEVPLGTQWNLRTTGTAMYQDIYAGSATNGAGVARGHDVSLRRGTDQLTG